MMDDILTLLTQVRQNPNIYLGKSSLELLFAFITGCLCYKNIKEKSCPNFLPGFQEFVQKKYNIIKSYGWAQIIRKQSSTDSDAFYAFFDLLDEFLSVTQKENL